MIKICRHLSLALAAMLAFGIFVAQGASASPLTCEGLALNAKCFATGDQDGGTTRFKTPSGEWTCTETSYKYEGTVTSASGGVNELTMIPSYKSCTAFGSPMDLIVNECRYTFTTPTRLKAGEVTWSLEQIHLVCGAKPLEITPTLFGASVCTQSIEPQTMTAGHIVGTNAGTAALMDITLAITLEKIHYKGTGGVCGNGETHTDASLNGASTVKCFSDAAHTKQVGCTFS
jgi:hypothetical protein